MSSNLYNDTSGVFINGLHANHLPRSLPRFVGRESETLHIKRLLSQKHLVILYGVDGVGKTRLAVQVADELAGQFQDGVFLISLDSIVQPDFIIETLALTLGIWLDPRIDSTEQFLAGLSKKSLLLILDGFDEVPQHTPLLLDIKERAPQVRTIVTSSKPLDVAEEAALELHGLSTPARGAVDAEESPAVQVFFEHARIFQDFEPDLQAIGHICRLVDGMPLAIELAASWASFLPCEQIAQRIEQSLALHPLEGISGELQSMLATFDSVWNLLTESERRVLLGLSGFKGGFSHQAATKITSASFFFLDELLNKKIIRRIQLQRYTLHPFFSSFLQEKLEENPVLATDVEIRHGAYFLSLLRDSEYQLQHYGSGPVLEEILTDIDNIRLAWKRTVAAGNLRLTLSALVAWTAVLESRGWYHEAIQALDSLSMRLAESYDAVPEAVLSFVQVKKSLAELHARLENYEASIQELQSALQRMEGSEIPEEQSEIYRSLGDYYRAIGVFESSREMYRHALVYAEKTGDLLLIYDAIDSMAEQAYLEADYPTAISTTEHALEVARQLQDKSRISQSQANLGKVYLKLNDYERAEVLLTEALKTAPDTKGHNPKPGILGLMGKSLAGLQDYRRAFQAYAQGLRLLKEGESVSVALGLLTDIAGLLNSTDQKPLALALVNLLVKYEGTSAETKESVTLLQKTLTSENVEPEKRDWNVDQLQRVVTDVARVLDEKAAAK